MLMKKFFLIAASALMVFASCTKVNINYENDGQPQEIGVFAVNKNMVKGAVSGSAFPEDYVMMVSSYLADGDGTNGAYFSNKEFTGSESNSIWTWTGGQYWPVSAATLNFLAVAPQVASAVTTSITDAGVATVTVESNEDNQYDVMYAVGQATKDAGVAPNANVSMLFKHALSWINFNFKTTNTSGVAIKINSVTINGATVNGTLTVTSTAYTSTNAQATRATWSATASETGINVPGAAADFTLASDYETFGNGLLVVPAQAENFVINYTITPNGGTAQTFNYTHTLTDTWDMAKKYTYNVSITLTEITIAPSVDPWVDYDADPTDNDVDNPSVQL